MNIALYARVSTRGQQQTQTLEQQPGAVSAPRWLSTLSGTWTKPMSIATMAIVAPSSIVLDLTGCGIGHRWPLSSGC